MFDFNLEFKSWKLYHFDTLLNDGTFGSETLETVTFMTIALRLETFPSAQSPARKNQVHQS